MNGSSDSYHKAPITANDYGYCFAKLCICSIPRDSCWFNVTTLSLF